MIGYDIGARFGVGDASIGPFGDLDAQYSKNFGKVFPVYAFMDATSEMGPLDSLGIAAQPDDSLNSASERLAGTMGYLGTGGEAGVAALPYGERSSFNSGDGSSLVADPQMLARYGRDGMGLGGGGEQGALFHPNYGGMLLKSSFGSAETKDMIDSMTSASLGVPVQKFKLGRDGGFSMMNEDNSVAENGHGRFYLPDSPGSAKAQSDAEYAYPNYPESIESGEGPISVPDAIGRVDPRPNLETAYEPLATSMAGGRSNEVDKFPPMGMVKNNGPEPGYAESGSASPFQNDVRAYDYQNSRLPEIAGEASFVRSMNDFEHAFSAAPLSSGEAVRIDAAGLESTIADLNRHFDQLNGKGATDGDGPGAVQQVGSWPKSKLQFPEGRGSNVDEAVRLPSHFSAHCSLHGMLDDEGMRGVNGMWEMLRNVQRLLPEQRIAGHRSAVEPREGLESTLQGLQGKVLAKGNVNDLGQDALAMQATRISSGGRRSGPSGHKNDPIYTVAINQVHGTFMPMVPTAGSSTRSPAMPGQRNLP